MLSHYRNPKDLSRLPYYYVDGGQLHKEWLHIYERINEGEKSAISHSCGWVGLKCNSYEMECLRVLPVPQVAPHQRRMFSSPPFIVAAWTLDSDPTSLSTHSTGDEKRGPKPRAAAACASRTRTRQLHSAPRAPTPPRTSNGVARPPALPVGDGTCAPSGLRRRAAKRPAAQHGPPPTHGPIQLLSPNRPARRRSAAAAA